MRVVGVDKDGRQRCWFCGGLEFTSARITRETVVLGIHANVTRPMLQCAHCGECSGLGRDVQFT
jgi:hypothetical protein